MHDKRIACFLRAPKAAKLHSPPCAQTFSTWQKEVRRLPHTTLQLFGDRYLLSVNSDTLGGNLLLSSTRISLVGQEPPNYNQIFV
jgi:hypothetical protein